MYLIFDTETTGLPKRWDAPITDSDNWPRCVQIAWQLHDEKGNLLENQDYLIKPDGFNIPYDAEKVHGISTALAEKNGFPILEVLEKFNIALSKAKFIVGHNVGFDINIMGAEFHRFSVESVMSKMSILDTCTENTAQLLKLPGGRGGRFKLPTLTELHQFLFNKPFGEAHNAIADVEATTRCFLELIRQKFFKKSELKVEENYFDEFIIHNPDVIQPVGLKFINLKEASKKISDEANKGSQNQITQQDLKENKKELAETTFSHLHNHTQFSILQSTIGVSDLVNAAIKHKMPAVAITDIANLMGAFQFVKEVLNYNKGVEEKNKLALENGEEPKEIPLKPIVGCELNICENHEDKSRKDNGYQVVFLAKNKKGYQNLVKMSSIGFTKGFYYVPRIDKKIVEQYKDDLIVLSGNLYGELPSKILNLGEKQAEEALLWWKEMFGEDFYVEIMRHGKQEDEIRANQQLINLARKNNVKIVATNNTYYLNKEDANIHDILLCVKDGEKQSTEIGRGRGFRYGLPNNEYYFKSNEEMKQLFVDFPEAITNIQEVVEKIEAYKLAREVLLPKFEIPQEFKVEEDEKDGGKRGENKYLKELTYHGAKKRYKEISPEIQERLDFELATIEKTGYPGYFLIVQDLIAAARKMDVSVGPGRGSAAGSAVAYCLGITNIDPIAYDLLFERFLNPDRVSLPDIDIDFDDEGRGKVMDYVINKYGASQVAQIITYGKMATKSAIRDTARVLDLPLFEADKIAKYIPSMMPSKWNLARFLIEKEDEIKKALKTPEEFENIKQLIGISNQTSLAADTIQQAKMLEGSLRNTGIHACGVIITPDDITNFVPVANAKDSELYVTQFDNSVVEEAGLLKMDFLGLKTLTLIKDTVKLVKRRFEIEIDIDNIPLDDAKTYELFQKGETVGVFQYESAGMQKHLKDLKPTVFADLIAMNALYRPGPLEYIPSFIKRKNGEEEIKYDLDACEEYLGETYGITVYQEQVMLLSQKLAGFSKGDADVLRKAMGKKQIAVLDKMKPKFIENAAEKGHDPVKLEKIWKDWEAFASYAFNKSHSTCYAWVAYQTAYLKAHYPAEYMAAVLSNNMNDIKQVTFFMDEAKRMGLKVLGPDVNESYFDFVVNKKGEIRFGLGAIKGMGSSPSDAIVKERSEKGNFNDLYDFFERVDYKQLNKRCFEALGKSGAFDSFGIKRSQLFYEVNDVPYYETLSKYGNSLQSETSTINLFGDAFNDQIDKPNIPVCEEWSTLSQLNLEKEVVGVFISGHPLDDYKLEISKFSSNTLNDLKNIELFKDKDIKVGGIVTSVSHLTSKTGKPYGRFVMEDYNESHEFTLFGNDYINFKKYLETNYFLFISGRVQGRRYDEKQLEFNIKNIQMLSEMRDLLIKAVKLKVQLQDINKELIEKIDTIVSNNKGECKVNVIVYNKEDNTFVEMPSKKYKINPSNELIASFEKINELTVEYV
jgi:DNA polymerase III subunit alpha